MSKPEDVIPANILAAARKAGLRAPLWYVGRQIGPPQPRKKTLADLSAEVEAKLKAQDETP